MHAGLLHLASIDRTCWTKHIARLTSSTPEDSHGSFFQPLQNFGMSSDAFPGSGNMALS